MPPKPKPKVSKPSPNDELAVLLKSPIYDKLINWLETGHPVKLSLPIGATLEQRALFQAKAETYEEVLKALRTLKLDALRQSIPVTYQPQGKQ